MKLRLRVFILVSSIASIYCGNTINFPQESNRNKNQNNNSPKREVDKATIPNKANEVKRQPTTQGCKGNEDVEIWQDNGGCRECFCQYGVPAPLCSQNLCQNNKKPKNNQVPKQVEVPSTPVLTKDNLCKNGSQWLDQCNDCHCSFGQIQCTRVLCSSSHVPKGQQCTVGSQWFEFNPCSWCECVDVKNPTCNKIKCPEFLGIEDTDEPVNTEVTSLNTVDKSQTTVQVSQKPKGAGTNVCTENTSWFLKNCNYCRCKNAKKFCTEVCMVHVPPCTGEQSTEFNGIQYVCVDQKWKVYEEIEDERRKSNQERNRPTNQGTKTNGVNTNQERHRPSNQGTNTNQGIKTNQRTNTNQGIKTNQERHRPSNQRTNTNQGTKTNGVNTNQERHRPSNQRTKTNGVNTNQERHVPVTILLRQSP